MDVVKARQPIIFLRQLAADLLGLSVLGEQRATQPHLFVHAFGVGTQQHFHAVRKVVHIHFGRIGMAAKCFGRRNSLLIGVDEQVKVIGHQAISQNGAMRSQVLPHLSEKIQVVFPLK